MPRKGFSLHSRSPPLRLRQDTLRSTSSTAGASRAKAEKFEKSEQGGSSKCNFRYGAAAMQGFRPHMQDDFSCTPSGHVRGEPLAFFGVFDGHGQNGEMVSQYCAENFLNNLLQRKAVRGARSLTCDILRASLRKTFLKFDGRLRDAVVNYNKPLLPDKKKISFSFSGTTATVALVSTDSVVVANVGDSRTLLVRSGGLHFATTDHNPGLKSEDDRIIAAGGKIHTTPSKHKVILDPEAYTNLAVSRTLGDFGFKRAQKLPPEEQIVTPLPDVTILERDHQTDEFLLLASDGIFKCLTNEEVVEFVKRQLTLTEDLTRICHNLIEMAYYSPGNSPDDTTVVLVVFPAAASPVPRAIKEDVSIEAECLEAIKVEVEKIVRAAEGEWVVENDFSVIQQLVKTLPRQYCVQLRNEFIRRTLLNAREDRFGVKDADMEDLVAKDEQTAEKEGAQAETDATTNVSDDLKVFTPGEVNKTPTTVPTAAAAAAAADCSGHELGVGETPADDCSGDKLVPDTAGDDATVDCNGGDGMDSSGTGVAQAGIPGGNGDVTEPEEAGLSIPPDDLSKNCKDCSKDSTTTNTIVM